MANATTLGMRRTPARWIPLRLLCYILAIVACVIAATVLTRLLVPPAPSPLHVWVWAKNLLLPVVIFYIYARLVRRMERRDATEVDLRRGFPQLLIGAAVGLGLIGAVVLILWSVGVARVAQGTGLQGVVGEILYPLVTAMGEELVFRVVLFGVFEDMFGTTAAILGSSVLFALSHAANAGSSPSALLGPTALGVVFALAYIVTRNVWAPIGLHMGWNLGSGLRLRPPQTRGCGILTACGTPPSLARP